MVTKFDANNKFTLKCLCKKSCNPRSQWKYPRNRIKCSKCCHLPRQDCGNASKIGEGTNTAMVSKCERRGDNFQAGSHTSIYSVFNY